MRLKAGSLLRVIPFLGLLFLFACGQEEAAFEKPYFDVKGLIDNEIELLDSLHPSVKKTVIKDGVKEELVLDSIKWKNELSSFLEVDINKPAWLNSYTQTEDIGDSTYFTFYTTTLEGHPVKYLEVETDPNSGRCVSFKAKKEIANLLYSSKQELSYSQDVGYSIKGELEVNMIFEASYSVEALFLDAYK